jgi:hypothetical protein
MRGYNSGTMHPWWLVVSLMMWKTPWRRPLAFAKCFVVTAAVRYE